ncbi:MAG: twin-arginine translocase subunit TatC [Myxococcales bacterium]|nr:twin-arginine translocase subunit TatC [Myxococcales bacterium]MDD9972064.1 twin-arginine translocase subunit TatC [Myxococcales bacterium]
MEHLQELRKRLVLSMLGMIPGTALGWTYAPELLDAFLLPYSEAFVRAGLGEPTIHVANPMDQIVAYIKIALVAGIFLGIPWIAWQVWAFISPALYDNEKRWAIPFVAGSSFFFTGGAYFGFSVVFPLMFDMLLSMSGQIGVIKVQPTIMLNEYISFATRLLLAFGAVFEIPVVVTVLSAAGIVTWKQLLNFGRWWVLLAAILSALLTPPDIGSQMLMIVPLVVLYFASVGVAYFIGPKVEDEEASEPDDPSGAGPADPGPGSG